MSGRLRNECIQGFINAAGSGFDNSGKIRLIKCPYQNYMIF